MTLAVFAACAAMVLVLWWRQGELLQWADAAVLERALRLGALILTGVAVYAVVLVAAGLRRRHLEKGAS